MGSVFQRHVVTDTGDVIAGADVTVREGSSGGPLADLYSDQALTTSISNPTTTDSEGFVRFYVAGGEYYILAEGAGASIEWEDVALGTAQSRDVGTAADEVPTNAQLALSDFRKGKRDEPLLAPANSNQGLETQHDCYIGVDGKILKVAEGTSIDLSVVTLTKGTDYLIWFTPSGTLVADTSMTTPPETGAVLVGGIHYAPGGNAPLDPDGLWANHAGGGTTPQFNKYAAWDHKWRPTAPDPRGLTLINESFWGGIYNLAADHMTGVVHRNATAPARDGDNPQNPYDTTGGRYSDANWFNISEALAFHGFENLNMQEFQLATIGTTEQASRGNDPVLTGLSEDNTGTENPDEAFTSAWGVIQSTGVIQPWSRDMFVDATDQSTVGLQGRGDRNRYVRAAILGRNWADGSEPGSRASTSSTMENSGSSVGGRGRAGHLILV